MVTLVKYDICYKHLRTQVLKYLQIQRFHEPILLQLHFEGPQKLSKYYKYLFFQEDLNVPVLCWCMYYVMIWNERTENKSYYSAPIYYDN